VQSFIYTITARGATSGLRGRSLYLQLLTEAMAGYVLRQLGLPPTSLLYAGGGHFYLVAPLGVADTIMDVRREVSGILLRHHQGELYLALGSADFTLADFRPDQFGAAWGRLGQAVSAAKRQRFSELGEAMYAQVFQPRGVGGEKQGECRVCHYEAGRPGELIPDREGRTDETGVLLHKCRLCVSLEKLGQDLRRAEGLILTEVEPVPAGGRATWAEALREFGLTVRVVREGGSPPAQVNHPARTRYLAFHDQAAGPARATLLAQGVPVLLRYTVNVTPSVTKNDIAHFDRRHPDAPEAERPELNTVKSFTLLQEQAQGIERLGVLRMDVDDLGSIFAQGFGRQGGLAQTAALSFALSLYFEGWVGHLAEQASNGRDVVYSIYSGGDDLFIVGAWDALPPLAHAIAQDLVAYAAGHPRIHASAGLTLHGGKFPLYQAAGAAAAALERAKEWQENGGRKNAFTFLGRTRPWADFPALHDDFQALRRLVQPEEQDRPAAPRGLLQTLIRLEALYTAHRRQQQEAGQPVDKVLWGPWHWRSAYQLTRLARQNKPVGDDIVALRDELGGANFSRIEL
jgi:CRISPR-associated protein Csm1